MSNAVKNYRSSYLVEIPKTGKSSEGYLSVVECEGKLPFSIKRIFWTYYTPESITRGRHAHYETELILIAVSGKIEVTIIDANENSSVFVLENPNVGLYIPPNNWHIMKYSHNAVQLVLASTNYEEKDYIRDYSKFLEVWAK